LTISGIHYIILNGNIYRKISCAEEKGASEIRE